MNNNGCVIVRSVLVFVRGGRLDVEQEKEEMVQVELRKEEG
jgi:hypothetical protein